MARRPTTKKDTSAANILMDSSFKTLSGLNGVKSGAEVAEGIEGVTLWGNLPLQYLLGIDVLAAGRSMMIVGPKGTGKSQLSWEIGKRVLLPELNGTGAPGIIAFIDVEKKTNYDQVQGIVNNDELFGSRVYCFDNSTHVQDVAALIKTICDSYIADIPKKDIPLAIIVDSLGALTYKEATENYEKTGETDTGFTAARRANEIQEFLKNFSSAYSDKLPVTLIMVNHQKEKIDGNNSNIKTKATPGGTHKDYAITWELETRRGKTDRTITRGDIINMVVTTQKSGFSKTGRKVEVEVVTRIDKEEKYVQFDWDKALVELLTGDYLTVPKDVIRENLTLTRKNLGSYNSQTLGLKDLGPTEMGQVIHNNPTVVDKLQNDLRILEKRKLGGWKPPAAEQSGSPELQSDGISSVETQL